MRPTGDVAQLEINSLTGLARGREKVATLEPTNNLRISKLISSYFVNVDDGKPLFSVFRRTEVVVRILQTARNFELLKTKVESRSWWRHTLETLYEAWKLFLVLQHYSAAIFVGFSYRSINLQKIMYFQCLHYLVSSLPCLTILLIISK